MADASLVQFDRDLTDGAKMTIILPGKTISIKFQFPPKILSDGKTVNWQVIDAKGYEPIKNYFGSESRKVQLTFEYIATGDKPFTPSGISKICRDIKSYAYFTAKILSSKIYPVVELSIYEIAPQKATFRMMNASISHGEEMIRESNGSGKEIWPLYTKISLDLELVTQGGDIDSGEGPKMRKENLALYPKAQWY